MENFLKSFDGDKKDFLNSIIGKSVRLMYDYSDLPDGHLGAVLLVGKIISVDLAKFVFELDGDLSSDLPLTVDGIVDVEII